MATAEDQVSKETLESISTGSFAQNVSNFRSVLLRYEKEVLAQNLDQRRAKLLMSEVTGMQEVISGQITRAGNNSRTLGVPPEDMQAVAGIYRRVLALLTINFASQYGFLNDPGIDNFIEVVQRMDNPPPAFRGFANRIVATRSTIKQVLNFPDSAYLVAPALGNMLKELATSWNEIEPEVARIRSSAPAIASTVPPVPPPPIAPGGGAGESSGSDLPRRVERLEARGDKMSEDITTIKVTLGRMEEFLKNAAMRADVARVEGTLSNVVNKGDLVASLIPINVLLSKISERLEHMPTKTQMYVAGGGAVALVLGLLAKAVKWL